MKINVQGYRILILPEQIEDTVKHGSLELVKAETTKDHELRNLRKGTVLQVGADCYGEDRTEKPWCKKGDKVLINPNAGHRHEEGDTIYLFVNEEDILAVIEE